MSIWISGLMTKQARRPSFAFGEVPMDDDDEESSGMLSLGVHSDGNPSIKRTKSPLKKTMSANGLDESLGSLMSEPSTIGAEGGWNNSPGNTPVKDPEQHEQQAPQQGLMVQDQGQEGSTGQPQQRQRTPTTPQKQQYYALNALIEREERDEN
eukprot:TRINITY_DN3662_c1_g1_i3.p1 TRINITY_DN3662_c1_g1~~TRINITY_DN3662_c1_g1_i3.p1  ORF type:complete len:153 (+),score=47.95 TRINITY_DN3662_c1_g1_i3:65-523(+)